MTSSLSSQLAAVYDPTQAPDIQLLRQDSKVRESILFDPHVAADLDNDEIFTLATAGFTELCAQCNQFRAFEEDFFTPQAKILRRADMSKEQSDHISAQLSRFLPLLSCFYLQDCGLKVLEWLIRHFHVHLMDMDSFIGSFLLYHETPLFPKALRILGGLTDHEWTETTTRNRWIFFRQIRKQQTTINRSFLVKRCATDFGFAQMIHRLLSTFADLSNQYNSLVSNSVSFLTVLLIEYFQVIAEPCIPQNVLLYFVPIVMEELQHSNASFSAYLMLLSQLCCKSQLSTEAIVQCLRILLINPHPRQPMQQIVLTAIFLIESQNCIQFDITLSDVLLSLEPQRDFIFSFWIDKPATKFEKIFVGHFLSKQDTASISKYLAERKPEQEFILGLLSKSEGACFEMLNEYIQKIQLANSAIAKNAATQSFIQPPISEAEQLTNAFAAIDENAVSKFVEIFYFLPNLSLQLQFLSTLLRNFHSFMQKAKVDEFLHLVLHFLLSKEKEIRMSALQMTIELSKMDFSGSLDKKFGSVDKLLAIVLSCAKQVENSSDVLVEKCLVFVNSFSNYCEFLYSSPLNKRFPACCYSTLELTSKCPLSKQRIHGIVQLFEKLSDNPQFKAPIDLLLDQLLLSNWKIFTEQVQSVSKILTMLQPLVLQGNPKGIQLCNLIWNDVPKCQPLLFESLMTIFAKKSSLLSGFARISPSMDLLESLLERLLASFSATNQSSKKMKNQSQSSDPLLLQGVFEYLLFQKSLIDNDLALFLVAGSFEILSRLISFTDASFDYSKQLVLSLLVHLISLPQYHQPLIESEDLIRVDVLVSCLRSNSNPLIQNQCFSCIGKIATVVPQRTIDCIIPLFTFMGSSVLRRDDASSINVVLQAIREIIPVVLANPTINAVELLSIFVTAIEHIPPHRLQSIFSELLRCLSSDDLGISYWLDMVVWTCVLQRITHPNYSTGRIKIPIDDLADLFANSSYRIALESLRLGMKRLLDMGNFASKKYLEFSNNNPDVRSIQSQDQIIQIRTFVGQIYRKVLDEQDMIAQARAVDSDALSMGLESSTVQDSIIADSVELLLNALHSFGKEKAIVSEIFSLLNLYYISIRDFDQTIIKLLSNRNILIQRKGLQLLNEKLLNVSLTEKTVDSFTKMAVDMMNWLDPTSINSMQSHLLAIDIVVKKIAVQRQAEFHTIATKLVSLLTAGTANVDSKVALLTCLGSFIVNLPLRMIGWISSYVPVLIDVLMVLSSSTDKSFELAIPSILNTFLALIKFQGAFISPYLNQILELLVKLYSKEIKGASSILDEIFSTIPQSVPSHVLLPIALNFAIPLAEFKPENRSEQCLLLRLIAQSAKLMSRDLLISLLPQFQSLLFTMMPLIESPSFVEFLSSFVLKMNSSLFSKFFHAVLEWTNENQTKRFGCFAKVMIYLFDILNLLFVEHFSFAALTLLNHCYETDSCLLDAVTSFKLYFELNKSEPADWIQDAFFNFIVGKVKANPKHVNSLIACCLSLGEYLGISSELWHSFHDLLISELPSTVFGKTSFCLAFTSFFEHWKEEYLVFLPSLLPTLAELLEDSNEQVEVKAKELVAVIETYLGEPVMKYLE